MTAADQGDVARWVQLVRAEYNEMPGMCLTKLQMQRLWGLEAEMCDGLVDTLVGARVLRKTATGTYVAAR